MSIAVDEETSTMRKKKSKSKTISNVGKKCAHRVYGNPSKKKPFIISQSQFTDDDLISQRLQFEWFARAQLQLQYF